MSEPQATLRVLGVEECCAVGCDAACEYVLRWDGPPADSYTYACDRHVFEMRAWCPEGASVFRWSPAWWRAEMLSVRLTPRKPTAVR